MSTDDIITIDLNNEIIERKEADNNLCLKIMDETNLRKEGDTNNEKKIFDNSTKTSEKINKLSLQILENNENIIKENNKLQIEILELNDQLSELKLNKDLNSGKVNIITKEEAELKAKEEAELKAKEEAELKAKEEAELKAKEEAELKAKETELKAKEEAELKAKEEAERLAKGENGLEIESENFILIIEDEQNINFINNSLSQLGDVKLTRLITGSNLKYLNSIKKGEAGYEAANELVKFFKIKFNKKESKQSIEALLKKQSINYFIETIPKDSSKELPAVDPSDEGVLYETQGYLEPAPKGIDAHCIWDNFPNTVGNPGLKTGFVDLESGWVLNHEDLPLNSGSIIFGNNRTGSNIAVHIDHGTAVVGEVAGVDNDRGVLGIAAGVGSVRASSHFIIESDGSTSSLNVAAAIIGAIPLMEPGDVLLLEVQRADATGNWNRPIPVESNLADFRAIQLATARGIIVVEAAGNGWNNLDNLSHLGVVGVNTFNRTSPDFMDSGAIMVGAITNTVPHVRAWFSNFGNRIDSCAWGNSSVTTTGYGDAGGVSMGPTSYTADFGGTSSASPIVVGAILLIQSYCKNYLGFTLTPQQMRTILQDPANGTPVFTSSTGTTINTRMGRQPDLCTIINGFETSDVYLRDNVADSGNIPSAGSISASPDIIVRRNTVVDPVVEYGEFSGTKFNNLLGYQVEFGQNNFIYTRKLNKGNSNAFNVTTDIYWSEVSTLPTPNLWNFIGTSNSVDVPTGNTLVVADPITWNKNDIPSKGHYCFVGITGNAIDPKTLTQADVANFAASGLTWDGFKDLIRNNNNVTWRNFNVVDVILDLVLSDPLDFIFNGAFDKDRPFSIKIEHNLEKLDWVIPDTLNENVIEKLSSSLNKTSTSKQIYYNNQKGLLCENIPSKVELRSILLNKNEIHRSQFIVKDIGSKIIDKTITVIQLEDNVEVGRVSWKFVEARKDSVVFENYEKQKKAEAERLAELKKQEEAKRLEELKKQEEAKRLEELKIQTEAERLAELKKQEEAKRLEELKNECYCEEDEESNITSIINSNLGINQKFYKGDSFKILDELYTLNNFIFYLNVKESPIIFGKQMPTNHVEITNTRCGIKSSSKNAREININNSTLELYNKSIYPRFEKSSIGVKKICINYCELGGMNALIIDGKILECKDFSILDGVTVGNNTIKVNENNVFGTKSDKRGTIIITNKDCLENVSIYGQELYIEFIKFCIGKCEKTLEDNLSSIGKVINSNSIVNLNSSNIGKTILLSTLK